MLKHKAETVIRVDYGDLEKLIEELYGDHEFQIACVEEASNDTSLTFTVKKEPLDQWAQAAVDKWRRTGQGLYITSHLLQDMANNGHVPEGNYVVDISW